MPKIRALDMLFLDDLFAMGKVMFREIHLVVAARKNCFQTDFALPLSLMEPRREADVG